MNKTKKLTTGAMLLAIVGALMLLDRQFSYLFDVYIVMMIPVVIIIYAAMYELKDGGILCVCLGILTFIIGSSSLNYVFYVPFTHEVRFHQASACRRCHSDDFSSFIIYLCAYLRNTKIRHL